MITLKINTISITILFTDTDRLMSEIKTEGVCEDFSKNIETFDFINYSAKSKYYDDLKKLVAGKMKGKTGGVAVEDFVGLKAKVDWFLVNDSIEHNKAKGVNKNVVSRINHSEYIDVLLNNKYLRVR